MNDHTRPSRRDAIRMGAVGAAALAGLAAVRRAAADCPTLTGSETQGPYWVDEMLNRSDIRSDPTSGIVQQGLPLRLGINVSELTAGACGPLAGVYVDIWHCNAAGLYSDTAAQGTTGQRFLRGYQVTDNHGNVRFLTIYPGYYNGRTLHIHFRVRRFEGTTTVFNFTSQIYFNDAVTDGIFARVAPYSSRPARGTRNSNDGLYNASLLSRLADNTSHAIASFNAIVDSVPGLVRAPGTLFMDEESSEHANDFGGGTPPLGLRIA
jgi:protocatechuate 3,4-dioxygenase beta subunit